MTALAQTNTTQSPRWQVIGLQALWVVSALAVLITIALAAPSYGRFFDSVFLPRDAALAEMGLPVSLRADYYPVLDAIWLLAFVATAIILFWRKPNNAFAVYVSITLMLFPLVSLPVDRALEIDHAELIPMIACIAIIGEFFSFLIGFLFPNGRFIPAWTKWVASLLGLWLLSWFFTPLLNPRSLPEPLDILVESSPYLVGASALIYRYFRVSTPDQRQQTKWVMLAIGLAVAGFLLFKIPDELLASNPAPAWEIILHLVLGTVYRVAEMFVPIAIAFAMLRYRLWDVDFIINRSLVYGGLSVLLGALFLGMIFALQPILLAFTGGGQPTLAAIGATLAVAAAFNPARKGLRRLIDRHLYGIKVDYSKPAAPEPRAESAPSGTTSIGPYGGLRLIGRGGMGEVYQGQHPTNGKPIAVKLLPASLAAEDDLRARFEREARTLSALTHPNIVRVYEFGEAAGIPYLVMEYIAGRDLSEHLKKTGPMPLNEVSAVLTEVAAALDYAHAQGLVHRDIKSSNIMLEDGQTRRAVLMDFGIAKLAQGTVLTNTGGVLGTFEYMSPEQIQASSEVDARADVYSLGVVAYQMLTGELPFTATSPAAILIAHLQTPPRNPASLRPNLPEETVDALLKALEKDPARRYQSAGEFTRSLC